jgi:LAO/AO transport system kinase
VDPPLCRAAGGHPAFHLSSAHAEGRVVAGKTGGAPANARHRLPLLYNSSGLRHGHAMVLPRVQRGQILARNGGVRRERVVSQTPLLLYTVRLDNVRLDTADLNHDMQSRIDSLRSGDVRTLARAISTVENRAPGWSDLLKALFPHSGRARVIGLTGAPGAGKSTLVDHLARFYRRQNRTVGIVAVDPTSPYTGGAILGDRIRMQEHFADSGIYIRSMATRGSLGGLARTTADVTTVLDASGRDVILVETVGVGQDEVDIVRLADITVVILVPGMGDDVQTIKAGIMEIADIFVINKSDREGAERVEREIRALQSLALRHDGWTPPIVKTVASDGTGVDELASAIAGFVAYLQKENLALKKSVQNWQERLVEMLRDVMLEKARAQLGDGKLTHLAEEVAEHKRDPYTLVEEIAAKANT